MQEQLIAAVAATGKPTVVVLMNGGSVGVERWLGGVGAVVESWYPGELGGDAIVQALLGRENRWGALPVTMYPSSAINGRTYYKSESAQLLQEGGITHMYCIPRDACLAAPGVWAAALTSAAPKN